MSGLTTKEAINLKTLCEFLFYDNYQYWATFSRFEKCFQPLFNNININLYEVFTGIAGKQKKYITYKRFLRAFLKYKKKEIQNDSDLHLFFNYIFTKILKKVDEYIGKHEDYDVNNSQNVLSFSTKKGGVARLSEINESFVSQVQVLNDKHDKITGIIIEYDDMDKYELFPKEIKKKLLLGLEINLDIINKDSFIRNQKLYENINLSLYRDSITHIFGTINNENIISFLGFKCVSGKTMYIGIPDGDSFLFGEFGKKFYNLRLEMKKGKGITLFEPGFIENKRKNYHLNKVNEEKSKTKEFVRKKTEKEEILMDEKYLTTMTGDTLNQFITTPVLEDSVFSNQEKKEKISGYDYKEVINQTNRDWIKNRYKGFGNYFAKIMFKDSNELLEKLKRKSIKRKDSIINKESLSDIFSYNPSQNPFFGTEITSEQMKPYNPFFSNIKPNKKIGEEVVILHKNVELIPKKEDARNIFFSKSAPAILFKGAIGKNTKPMVFLKKKHFQNLKKELTTIIYKQFYNQYYKKNNINSTIPFIILNEIVPYEQNEKNKENKRKIKNNKKKVIKRKGEFIEIDNELEQMQELNETDKNEENLINSDGYTLWNDISYNYKGSKKMNERNNIKKLDNLNRKQPEENWHYLTKRLRFFFGINLLQTIKSIMNALNAILKEKIPLEDKIKYYNILSDKDNEKVIKFLSQNDEEEEKNEEDEEDILLLNKNPEMFNSLENLDKTINNLKNQIPIDKQDEKSKINYKKALHYLIQEKNILIENITNNDKEKLLENYNYRGFIYEEKRKRTSWEQDDERKLTGYNFFDSNFQEIEKIDEYEDISKLTFHGQDFNFTEGKDPNFVPIKESLCPLMDDNKTWKLPESVLNSDVENWELINWEKSEAIKRVFYSNNAQPILDNIRQGEYIGDCYFLSALGSLCKEDNDDSKKDYLKNLVKVVKRDKNSIIYSVKLNINGKWKHVLVDNYFPFILNQNGKYNFCFGSSFKKELWVSLFEKAWAKINGCYARIAGGGHCSEAFDALTDAYTELIRVQAFNDKRDILWNKLIQGKKNNYVMCVGSKHFGLWENNGLISNHAYTLMNLYELKEENLKLVKLRNPWGEKEFIGDWSDKSSKWTEEIKQKVEFNVAKDDGIFYMSYDDFIKYFELLEILKIREGYGTVGSCKIKKMEAYKCQIIKFEIKEKRHIFINLYQKNPRIIRKNGTYFPQPVKSFVILAKQEFLDKYTYIKSIINIKVHGGIEAELDAGTYLIFCDVNYRFVYDEIYGYNITFYSKLSQGEIKVNNITNNFNGKKRSEILSRVIYNYYESKKGEKKFTEIKTKNGIKFYKLNNFNEEFPFIILLFENTKKERVFLNCSLKYELNNKNVCIYNDSEATEFDRQVIKKINDDYTVLLLMGYSISDRFSFSYNFTDVKKELSHMVFNDKCRIDKESGDNFMYYVSFTENRRGCILGLKKIKGDKADMSIKLKGLITIDPFYDDMNKIDILSDTMLKIKFKMTQGESKVFNLRFKPNCEDFDYEIEH